jgi:hypothetical protein
MRQFLSSSSVDLWVAMDTYYSGLPMFFDNMEWYLNKVFSRQALHARKHALHERKRHIHANVHAFT